MVRDRVGIGAAGVVERVGRVAAARDRSVVADVVKAEAGSTVAGLVAEGPPVDVAKVAAIRAAIADGSYGVDADAIAARLMAGE